MRAIGTESGRTWRANNFLAKTRAADYLFMNPRLRAIVQNFLADRTQINITTLFNALPGETKKFLHQDDGLWPIPRPHPHFLCNALIALDDFGVENGATHLVPYIHQWHDLEVDQAAQTIQVEMKAGSMVLRARAMWHAGGANTSQPERMGVFILQGVSYLRPQEPQLISVPAEVVKTLPEKMQRLLGYTVSVSGLMVAIRSMC
jgi:ectoine hydroxylase-related dioxygenase (phytanoyl-CoA dioxygenase family)